MDIPREPPKNYKRYIYGAIAVVAIIGITYGLSQLEQAAPTVDRATVWVDEVKRGEMVRQVRGPGTLVPMQVFHVTSEVGGRVEQTPLLAGVQVEPETVLVELSAPAVELAYRNAEQSLRAAEARYENRRVELQTQLLQRQAQAATVQADFHQARLTAERDQELYDEGLTSQLELELSQTRAEELATRNEIEKRRVTMFEQSIDVQLAVERAQLEQARAEFEDARADVESLTVRAGVNGVLRELDLEVGQRVQPGELLAVVVDPNHLKAELRIDQTQAKDIALGQPASIDTRNGLISGEVSRIDPAVQDGVVQVDVELLDEELPQGARPDLSVDGTIEIERLEDVLYVGRPAYGQSESRVGLFKLTDGGDYAVRVNVQLGRSSVNTIEIRNGLEEGDDVILSDMSRWDGVDRIRLN